MAWHFLAVGYCSPAALEFGGLRGSDVSAQASKLEQLLAGGGGGLATHFTSPGVAPWRAAPGGAWIELMLMVRGRWRPVTLVRCPVLT